MTIEHQPGATKGRFMIREEGLELGELTYSVAGPDKIIIDHTEGFPGSEGKGVGKQLVAAAVAHARAHGLQVMPLCPFANRLFQRTPEWQDLIF